MIQGRNNLMITVFLLKTANQEDSLIINKAAIERGLFDGCKFTYYKTEFEQKEEMGNPDASKTDGLKSANYEKLTEGIVKKNQHINDNDVLIGKYMPIQKENDKYTYTDRSIVYKEDEHAIVHNVIVDRNEDDMKFAKVALRKIRPVAIGDKFCLGYQHEVLTSIGWKKIADVTLNDKVATLNPRTNELEWQNPTNVYKFEHVEKIYEIKNSLIHLMTTMNHKMYVKRSSNGNYNLEEAKDVLGKKVWYKRDCVNNNVELDVFNLPAITLPWKTGMRTYPARQFDMNDWLTFVGIYLAEGHIDQARNLRISAHKPRVATKLDQILANMSITSVIYPGEEDYRYIKSHQISNYFMQFGKANYKFIPDWCKSMGPINSKSLLDGLLLGDGYYMPKRNSYEYYTNSRKLANDVQILAIMTGQSATITTKNLKGEKVVIKGNLTERSANQYRVYITTYKPCMQPVSDYRDFEEEVYEDCDETVYCIEVPNHIFMTRLDKKYCWTGNSSRSG